MISCTDQKKKTKLKRTIKMILFTFFSFGTKCLSADFQWDIQPKACRISNDKQIEKGKNENGRKA